MRKAAAIAIAAVVIAAVAVYLGQSAETTVAPPTVQQQPPMPKPVATDAVATSTSTNSETFPPSTALLTGEEHQQAACAAMWESKAKRGQAVLAAEPKDPAWAYAMEEKLRDYMARRFQGTQIDVIKIDCRTSYCEITAQGVVETATKFAEGISAVASEPGNDFSGSGTSHTEEPDKILHHGTVSRKQPGAAPRADRPDAAELACIDLANQRQQRRRTAEDAQPRDASWADPTEQLLRQHIVGLLVKHPADQLDINCKTTFCQIKASGHTRESLEALQKATQDAAAQPWAENLWLAGAGGSSSGDIWKHDFTLYRRDKMNQ